MVINQCLKGKPAVFMFVTPFCPRLSDTFDTLSQLHHISPRHTRSWLQISNLRPQSEALDKTEGAGHQRSTPGSKLYVWPTTQLGTFFHLLITSLLCNIVPSDICSDLVILTQIGSHWGRAENFWLIADNYLLSLSIVDICRCWHSMITKKKSFFLLGINVITWLTQPVETLNVSFQIKWHFWHVY